MFVLRRGASHPCFMFDKLATLCGPLFFLPSDPSHAIAQTSVHGDEVNSCAARRSPSQTPRQDKQLGQFINFRFGWTSRFAMRGLSTPRAVAQRVVKGPHYNVCSMALRLSLSIALGCTKLVAVLCARLQDGGQDTLPTHPVCHGNHGLIVVAPEVRHDLTTKNEMHEFVAFSSPFFEKVRIRYESVTKPELTFFKLGHNL